VLGIRWVPTLRQECGVLGDALIAAAASGYVDDITVTAERWQETGTAIEPDPEVHKRYQRFLSAYRDLGERLAPIFDRLGSAS
jgi:xylulokinase